MIDVASTRKHPLAICEECPLRDAPCAPTTKNGITVCNEDAHLLELSWYIKHDKGKSYAMHSQRVDYLTKHIPLHRMIMGVDGPEVDHVNGNGLDNRRCNLRHATRAQNMANQSKNRGGSSQYKGVYFDRSRSKWIAKIGGDNHLGRFDNEADAARAYDIAARERWGDFARTNF